MLIEFHLCYAKWAENVNGFRGIFGCLCFSSIFVEKNWSKNHPSPLYSKFGEFLVLFFGREVVEERAFVESCSEIDVSSLSNREPANKPHQIGYISEILLSEVIALLSPSHEEYKILI